MKPGAKAVLIVVGLVVLGALIALSSKNSSRGTAYRQRTDLQRSMDNIARIQATAKALKNIKPIDPAILENIGKPFSEWKFPKAGGAAAPAKSGAAPAPPKPKDRFDIAREECARSRCVAAVRKLAAHQPRGEPEIALLRSLVPSAIAQAQSADKPQTVRSLYPLALEVGARLDQQKLESALERAILRRAFDGRDAFLVPDVRGDSAARSEWLQTDYHRRTVVRGSDGLEWYKFPSRGPTGRDNFVLVSAYSTRARSITEPGFLDRLEALRISPLDFRGTEYYWKSLLWKPLKPAAVFLLLYVIATLIIAPRWLGKLLWLLRLRRLARFFFQWACWRQRTSSPALLAGKACDFARAAAWRVQRKMTARARADLLASAERHLRQASLRKPKVDAWLARILFLQGRIEDAERSAKHSTSERSTTQGRVELARVLIARGKVATAGTQLSTVAWWRTLSADAMWLRAIVAFHAGQLPSAGRWLFFARRSRFIRRQSALLVAALRERLGQARAAEKAARKAATSGIGVVCASTWLARRARAGGDSAQALRWATVGLGHRPGHPPLELEAALSGDGGLDAMIALAKRHPRSAATLAAAFAFAAKSGVRHPYLDAREGDDDDAPAALWEARGDYAHASGDDARALNAWVEAARDDATLAPIVRLRAHVLSGEALAQGRAELALELVRAAKLDGPVAVRAARAALYASLERSKRGLPLRYTVDAPAEGEPEARALFALLQGDAKAAMAAAPQGLRERLAPLLEQDRPLSVDEARAFTGGAPGNGARADAAGSAGAESTGAALLRQRVMPLHDAFASLQSQVRDQQWSAALQSFEGLRGSLRLGSREDARTAAAVVSAILRLQAGAVSEPAAPSGEAEALRAESMVDALEVLRQHHRDGTVRAVAEHDLAVARTPVGGDGRRGSGRWRLFAQAWDRVFQSSTYRAHLLQRVLELDDARLDSAALDEVLEEAKEMLGARLRPFLEARASDGEPVPAWVRESPLAQRAAMVYVEALTRTAETALAAAEDGRKDKQQSPGTWKNAGQTLRDVCARLGVLGVAPERTQALRERTSNAFINLSVDANAIGAYDVAVDATTAALALTRTPENQRLCAGNLAIYENNRARNLPPPGA